MLTFPGQPTPPQFSPSGITATLPNAETIFVFDAVPVVEHEQRLTKTKHPVQTGSNIQDHAYIEPAELVLDVRMSDAMDAYAPGIWVGGPTKSVSAFQIMLAIAYSRIPVQVTTKLRTYKNMLLEVVSATESPKTYAGLNMRIRFGEVFVASTQTVPVSARPQDTQTTGLGSVTTQAPTQAQTAQHQVTPAIQPVPDNVPGAGIYSSNNVSTVGGGGGPSGGGGF